MTTSMEERVAAGVEKLDEVRPGWRDEINLEELHMERADACILGQLYGSFWVGRNTVFGPQATLKEEADHGFWQSRLTDYDALQQAWEEELTPVDA